MVEEAKADSRVAGQHEVEIREDGDAVERAAGLAEKPEHQRLRYLVEHRSHRRDREPAPEHHPRPLSNPPPLAGEGRVGAAAGTAALAPRSSTSAQRWQRS